MAIINAAVDAPGFAEHLQHAAKSPEQFQVEIVAAVRHLCDTWQEKVQECLVTISSSDSLQVIVGYNGEFDVDLQEDVSSLSLQIFDKGWERSTCDAFPMSTEIPLAHWAEIEDGEATMSVS